MRHETKGKRPEDRPSSVPPSVVRKSTHQIFMERLAKEANGQEMGPCAKAAHNRPDNYGALSTQGQWDIDKTLGILDWDGSWNK